MDSKMREINEDKGQNEYDNDKFSSYIALQMLNDSRTEIETPGDENWESASALLNGVAHIIRARGGVVDHLRNSLTFHVGYGRTHVEVKGMHAATTDNQEVENVVLIRTELPEMSVDSRGLPFINTMASLGAMVNEGNSKRVSIVSRLSMFRRDDGPLTFYVSLVACSTLFHVKGLLCAITPIFGIQTPRLFISDDQEGPSRWSRYDFECAAEKLKRFFGVLSAVGDDDLTAEIPWEPGGLSTMTGNLTSLLTFDASIMHLAMGSGLFYKLELPLHFEEDELVFLANKLNQAEFEAVDAPPFLGAWCCYLKTGRLCHVGFWPNMLYEPGAVEKLGAWMFFRNRQAMAFISNNRK